MTWTGAKRLERVAAELIIRGTVMYLFLFLLSRRDPAPRRPVGMADILVLVIIADAAQNGMSGEYRSVTEGAILVGTIIAWNVILDWLTYKSRACRRSSSRRRSCWSTTAAY